MCVSEKFLRLVLADGGSAGCVRGGDEEMDFRGLASEGTSTACFGFDDGDDESSGWDLAYRCDEVSGVSNTGAVAGEQEL